MTADALISVGNANERIELPAMERVLGPAKAVSRLAGASPGSVRAEGGLEVELQILVGATNQLGLNRLRSVES